MIPSGPADRLLTPVRNYTIPERDDQNSKTRSHITINKPGPGDRNGWRLNYGDIAFTGNSADEGEEPLLLEIPDEAEGGRDDVDFGGFAGMDIIRAGAVHAGLRGTFPVAQSHVGDPFDLAAKRQVSGEIEHESGPRDERYAMLGEFGPFRPFGDN